VTNGLLCWRYLARPQPVSHHRPPLAAGCRAAADRRPADAGFSIPPHRGQRGRRRCGCWASRASSFRPLQRHDPGPADGVPRTPRKLSQAIHDAEVGTVVGTTRPWRRWRSERIGLADNSRLSVADYDGRYTSAAQITSKGLPVTVGPSATQAVIRSAVAFLKIRTDPAATPSTNSISDGFSVAVVSVRMAVPSNPQPPMSGPETGSRRVHVSNSVGGSR